MNMAGKEFLGALASFAASQVLFALCFAAGATTYQVDIDSLTGLYRCGETAVFRVTLLSTNDLSAAKPPFVTLDNFGSSVLTYNLQGLSPCAVMV